MSVTYGAGGSTKGHTIALAGEIQKQLLPEEIPPTLDGEYSIGRLYVSMMGVGGDYYDFEAKQGELWIIDVTSEDFNTYIFGRSVDDREIGEPGPITRTIQETYAATVRGQVESYRGWLDYVHH